MIPKTTLGRTGLQVTQLGYGSMGLRGPNTWGVRVVDDSAADTLLNRVLDAGLNFIDTAPDYGVSEARIGRFISHRRSEFILATKCGCDYTQHEDHIEIQHRWTKDVVQRNVEQSLTRLQTDHIDLMQFHGGDARSLRGGGLLDQLIEFREQGVIRFLGASSSIPHLAELIKWNVFDTFQVPYSCLAPQHSELIQEAVQQGAGIIVRGGIAHGGPDAEIKRPQLDDVWQAAGLDEVLPPETSRAEFILRCTLAQNGVGTVIVGTCNPQHFEENLAAVSKGPVSPEIAAEVASRVEKALASGPSS
jgi:aryl-alcohol dehydrogenase-like predicted oxidoreductase